MRSASALLAARYPFVNALLTKRPGALIALCAGAMLAMQVYAFFSAVQGMDGLALSQGPILGGDFVVFDVAANAIREGRTTDIYDPAVFSEDLHRTFPDRGSFLLSWQYPPTMLLLIAPLAFLSYLPSYILWVVAGAALFLVLINKLWTNGLVAFVAIASPAAYQAAITGQTGFLTASLLIGAALWADKRPWLAGLAAGILTVKPQLGLLIPIAFALGGCWRAFAVALASALIMACLSVTAFGVSPWLAFAEAVTSHGGLISDAVFPHYKLITVYGGALMLGAPPNVALALQGLSTLLLAIFVGAVWRSTAKPEIRIAALCAAAPLATPYAFYYEIIVLVPAALAIARLGLAHGWLAGERWLLAGLWLAPAFMPGPTETTALTPGFLSAAAMLLLVLRRASFELHFFRKRKPIEVLT